MALQTKSFSSARTSNAFTLVLTVTENSTSIDNNTSSVSYSLALKSGGWNFSQFAIGWKITLAGTVVSSQAKNGAPQLTLGKNSSVTIKSGTATIPHNGDGGKTMSVAASIDMAKASYTPGPMSLSGSMNLTSIPRASSLSFGGFTIGSGGTITINRASNAFTHTLTYTFESASASGTIASKTGSASVVWTPPVSLLNLVPTTKSGKGRIICTTYSGGTKIGEKSHPFSAAVAAGVKPSISNISVSPVNSNSWISGKGIYVADFSKVRVTISATPGAGSTIASYAISGVGNGSGSDWTSGVLSSGSKTINVTVTDRRERSESESRSITVHAYSVPGISDLSYVRGKYTGGVWTDDSGGSDVKVSFKLGLGLAAYGNTADITVKLDGTEKVNAAGQTGGSKTYYITGIGTDVTRALVIDAADKTGRTGTASADIPTVSVDFNWNPDLHGLRFGGVAEDADCFRCSLDARFDDELTIAGHTAYHAGNLRAALLNLVHPIGSIYTSTENVNPGALFGGTWAAFAQGRFILGAGGGYTAGSTGGAATVALTTAQLPNIKGSIYDVASQSSGEGIATSGVFSMSEWGAYSGYGTAAPNAGRKDAINLNFGGNQPHNNMPPYIACYIWRRTA